MKYQKLIETLSLSLSQYRYRFIRKYRAIQFKVLEIGIGNDSPYRFKKYFKKCLYDGLDVDLNYNLSEKSIFQINRFYKMNLENPEFSQIPDSFYDYILIAHVIEHINNGEEVIKEICKKISFGGYIYIEYPSEKSKYFPSMKGTLNFYDDKTHKRFYDIKIINNILVRSGFSIIKSGRKKDYLRIIALPYMIIKSLIKYRYIRGSIFWDVLGFAEYIFAKKILI